MSRYYIEITEPAEKDLYKIGYYIAKEFLESGIAIKVIEKISDGILKLEEMPMRNALVADERLSNQGIRKIIIVKYGNKKMTEESFLVKSWIS